MSADEVMKRQSVISNSDAELADLIATQPSEAEISLHTSKQINGWELPLPAQEFEGKRYKYRWLSRDKRLLIQSRSKGWLICKRENSPYLPKEGFGLHGGFANPMYPDHILGFMPIAKSQAITQEQSKESRDAVKHYTEDIKKDPRFYDAKIGGDDGGDENPSGLTQGRDF